MANQKGDLEIVEKDKLRKISVTHNLYYCRENVLLRYSSNYFI